MFYEIFEKIGEKGIELLLKGLMAIGIWIVGSYLIKTSKKIVFRKLDKQGMDPSLKSFFDSLGTAILYVMLAIITISTVGVQTSSLVAILGAAGLAIGLALQRSLSNFAGGVLIIIFRPFNVGDYIDSQGNKGFVEEIQLLYTVIDTEENKKIVMPNSAVYSNIIAVDVNKTK